METMNYQKLDANYYQADINPVKVELGLLKYLSISGQSAPEAPVFNQSIAEIYSVVNALKNHFTQQGNEFEIAPMEANWWVEKGGEFKAIPRTEWFWRILIPLPEFISATDFENLKNPLKSKVSMEEINEGTSVQILHIGSYEEEDTTIEKIIDFMGQNQLAMSGYHHEIYLNDPKETPVEELKTIIRYPVRVKN
ncbi:MAG: GyrI-like domain-containing protein [Flammeovirgaceae bacterium]|nr:GyrI-like domain-containing protein [Flammeovirgaceae bacterium]